MPQRKEPRRTARPATDEAARGVRTWKIERLQEREQAAADIAACESQKGALRLDGILREQKNSRDEIGEAQNGLNDRDKGIEASARHACKGQDESKHSRQDDNNAKRNSAMPRRNGHARDQGGKVCARITR